MVDEVMGALLKENINKAAVEHRTEQATARALAAARLAQQRQARGLPVARPVQALAPPTKASSEEIPTGSPTEPPTSLHHAYNTPTLLIDGACDAGISPIADFDCVM